MSEGVTYADLQFARSPPEKSQQEEPNEGELTYENVQGPWAQEEEAAGGPLTSVQDPPLWPISCHLWSPVTNRQMLGALTVFLFLLAASIGLGIQCLQASQQLQQVSRQLQQASQDHVAEQHVLGEELHALRVSLEESQHLLRQAQEELNSTAVALWESQAAENQTRRQLQRQGLLLTQANHSLALLQTERESAEASLSQATSCQQIGCCAPGWTLFRWRCLQASTQKKTWEESADACKRMTSQLLVLKPWSARELWEAVGDAYGENPWDAFWVGLRCEDWKCKWVDDSPYQGSEISWTGYHHNPYISMRNGHLQRGWSSTRAKYICEKAASPERPPPPN
ncbi:uncharacterized protein PHA67_014711 isoform 3-T4 [Liasis olivaceus]